MKKKAIKPKYTSPLYKQLLILFFFLSAFLALVIFIFLTTYFIKGLTNNNEKQNAYKSNSESSFVSTYLDTKYNNDTINENNTENEQINDNIGSSIQDEVTDSVENEQINDNNTSSIQGRVTNSVENDDFYAIGTVITQTDPLNVRKSPSIDSEKIGEVPKGSTIIIIGYIDGWYQIEYRNQTAYVSAQYVELPLRE